MSWMEGVGPVQDVSEYGISKGLSEDWHSDASSKKEIKKGKFWDIIDNPLYQVAAEAKGYDWDDWVKDAKGKVGTGPNDGTVRVRATVKAGTPGRPATTRRGGMRNNSTIHVPATAGTPAEYEWMTRDEADERGLEYEEGNTSRWLNKDTDEIHIGINPRTTGGKGNRYDDDKWKLLRDWGIDSADISEDLDEMSKWLHKIVSINDHLPKIIREGPKGEHYGIEGDIWEHYGLDKEPVPPKEMEWDSYDKKVELDTAVKSTATYSTPEGMEKVNLR